MFDSFVFPVRITRYPKDKQTFPSISRLLVTLNLAAERRRFVATLEENLQGLLLDKNLYRRKKKEDNSICQYPSFYFFFGARCVIEILGIGIHSRAGMCAQIAVLTNWVISQHVPFLTLSYFTD